MVGLSQISRVEHACFRTTQRHRGKLVMLMISEFSHLFILDSYSIFCLVISCFRLDTKL